MQITTSDPKMYNALARTNKKINGSLDPTLARASFLSTIDHTYDKWSGAQYFVKPPALCGMIHTPAYISNSGENYCIMSASFGKLSRVEGQPSFQFVCRRAKISIYANKGVVSREHGPAVVILQPDRRHAERIEIYSNNGIAHKVLVVTTGSLWNNEPTRIIEMWLNDCEDIEHQTYTSAANMIGTLEDFVRTQEVVRSISSHIFKYCADRYSIISMRNAFAALGTDILSIDYNISLIAKIVTGWVNLYP